MAIICLKDDIEVARNMKLLLYLYEIMSGLKINFAKSEVYMINGDNEKHIVYAELFNCQTGMFPYQILGGSSLERLHVKDWTPLIEKNKKTLFMERKFLIHSKKNNSDKLQSF